MLNIDYSSKFVSEGLTFDDVLLIPAYSEVTAGISTCILCWPGTLSSTLR